MSENKIISIHLHKDQFRGIIVKSDKKTYAQVLKTKMIKETRLGKRIIKEEINPLIIIPASSDTMCLMPRFMPYCLGLDKCYTIIYKSPFPYIDLGLKPRLRPYGGTLSENKAVLIPRILTQLEEIGGVTLKLNTGKGKSVILSYVAWWLGKHTFFASYTAELSEQLYDEVVDKMGNSVRVVRVGSSYPKDTKALMEAQTSDEKMRKYLEGKQTIIICVYKSAHKLNDTFWKYIYFAAFDESHCYCNTTGINIIENCKVPKIMALSATPTYDWKSMMAPYWCGPILDGDTFVPDRELSGKVSIISYYGKPMYTEAQRDVNGKKSVTLMVKLLGEDPDRNKLIIDNIVKLLLEKYVIYVFSCRNDMLAKLDALLKTRVGSMEWECEPPISGILVGETPKELRREIKASYNVIFTNYAFTRVGINIPHATASIYASPYKENGKQINGRILRSNDSIVRRYIDIVDENTSLKTQLNSRIPDYLERKFEVEYLEYAAPLAKISRKKN